MDFYGSSSNIIKSLGRMEQQRDEREVLVTPSAKRNHPEARGRRDGGCDCVCGAIRLILTSFLTGCSHVHWAPSADWPGSPSPRRSQPIGDEVRGVEEGLRLQSSSRQALILRLPELTSREWSHFGRPQTSTQWSRIYRLLEHTAT